MMHTPDAKGPWRHSILTPPRPKSAREAPAESLVSRLARLAAILWRGRTAGRPRSAR